MDSRPVRVYIANYAAHDYSNAKRYGEIYYITKGFISFQGLDRVLYMVAEGIASSSPEDWLALSGTNIINVMAAVLWFQMHGCVKVLNWDKESKVYREMIMTPENSEALLSSFVPKT